jgi:DNA repair protein RecN (Recombination protein N)
MALLELAVTDLALLERARLRLGSGLTVITGETGAGKSLLIDALALAIGGRADVSLIRAGAAEARVEALFERDPEPLICVRELSAGGRSVARIDDQTVTVATLAATAGPLIEIHGQHEQQKLLASSTQRELLDAFGGHDAFLATVAGAVLAWRANRAALRELELDPGELERRLELADHAVAEIAAADPKPGEVADLRERLAAASNAEQLARLTASAQEALAGEGTGARDRLALAARDLHQVSRNDGRLAELAGRIDGLEAEVADVSAELARIAQATEEDVRSAVELEERLARLYGLLRKYGDTEEEVLAHAERAGDEAARLRGLDRERATRVAEDEVLRGAAEQAAASLSEARHRAADRLAEAVTAELTALGIADAAFSVALELAGLETHGADEVTFLLAPNPGEPARPLARIASGGELSRVSLAIKEVLAGADGTPTRVFDEIDAGIGSRSADPIGRSLWRLARFHQVLCVTHLPQIAAWADAHVLIGKDVQGGRSVTTLQVLDEDERLTELTAMLGAGASQSAEETARELLRRSSADRAQGAAPVA